MLLSEKIRGNGLILNQSKGHFTNLHSQFLHRGRRILIVNHNKPLLSINDIQESVCNINSTAIFLALHVCIVGCGLVSFKQNVEKVAVVSLGLTRVYGGAGRPCQNGRS
jgi:hypothetical protein